jgi:hypothetical protein
MCAVQDLGCALVAEATGGGYSGPRLLVSDSFFSKMKVHPAIFMKINGGRKRYPVFGSDCQDQRRARTSGAGRPVPDGVSLHRNVSGGRYADHWILASNTIFRVFLRICC